MLNVYVTLLRHNGAALSVIKSCVETLPAAGSIAYFDTTFHRSIPRHISSYAIDQKIATDRGLKKYGFHGLSCSLILASILEPCAEAPSSDAFIHRSVASHFEKVIRLSSTYACSNETHAPVA